MSLMQAVCMNIMMAQVMTNQQIAQQQAAQQRAAQQAAAQQANTVAVNQQQEPQGISEYDFISKVDDDAASENKTPLSEEEFLAEITKLEERYANARKTEDAYISICDAHSSFNLSLVTTSTAAQFGIIQTTARKGKLSSLRASVQNTMEILNTEKTLVSQQVESQEKKKDTIAKEVETLKNELDKKGETVVDLTQKFIDGNDDLKAAIEEIQNNADENKDAILQEYLANIDIPSEYLSELADLNELQNQLLEKEQELSSVEENISILKENVSAIDERISAQNKLIGVVNNQDAQESANLAYLNLSKIQLQWAESAAKKNNKWYKKVLDVPTKITNVVCKAIKDFHNEIGGFIDKRLGLEGLGCQVKSVGAFSQGTVQIGSALGSLDKAAISDSVQLIGRNALPTVSLVATVVLTYVSGGSLGPAIAKFAASTVASEVVTRETGSEIAGAVAGAVAGAAGGAVANSGLNLSSFANEFMTEINPLASNPHALPENVKILGMSQGTWGNIGLVTDVLGYMDNKKK